MCHTTDNDVDIGKLRFSETKLYGRSSEVSQLLRAYKSLKDADPPKPPEMVVISGESGTGKTAITNPLQKAVNTRGGYFISGKFDFSRRIEPYTALIAAFTELSDIISNDINALFRLKVDIQEAVGAQGKALTDVIPSLKRIINQQGDAADVSPLDAGNRFKYVLRNFVGAICTPSCPMVLFLDDLQWADPASLDVIQTLLLDTENNSLLVVGSYRSDEVGPDHHVSMMLRSVQEESVNLTKIDVRNLNVLDVNGMLSELLSEGIRATGSLANIVHQKTQGNVFYVKQFLMALCDEGLLSYSIVSMKWQWYSDKIKAMNVTKNVVDLLMNRMKAIPQQVTETMQVAACLGSTFQISLLKIITKDIDIEGILEAAMDEGLIEMEDREVSKKGAMSRGLLAKVDGNLRFVHDQIQLALFLLIPENERGAFRHRIGEILFKELTAEELEKNLFVVVDLLNYDETASVDNVALDNLNLRASHTVKSSLVFASFMNFDESTSVDKVTLANLNLKASQKAKSSLAFAPCIKYAKSGMDLLGEKCWKDHYELSLNLHSIAAEALYCSGSVSETTDLAKQILGKAKSFDDKYYAYVIVINTLASQGNLSQAIRKGLRALKKRGVYFPKFADTRLGIFFAFRKTKHLLDEHSNSDFTLLPAMEDKNKIEGMRLLDILVLCTYHARQKLMPLLIFKMVRWSIRYGLCKYSPAAFAAYGMYLCNAGYFRDGYEIGQVALHMLDRLKANEVVGRVNLIVYGYVNFWRKPYPSTMRSLVQGYQQGMESGDVRSAMMCIHQYGELAFYSGYPLYFLAEDLKKFCLQMKEYNQKMVLGYAQLSLQMVMSLMTGKATNQDKMLLESKKESNSVRIIYIRISQMVLYYYFGDYKKARKAAIKAKSYLKFITVGFHVIIYEFFEGLTAIALAQETKRKQWKTIAKKNLKKMGLWAESGNVNVGHMITLLEAELLFFEGMIDEAEEKYKSAITKARRRGFTHDRALASERLGKFFYATGENVWAAYYLLDAYKLWVDWGANVKAKILYETYSYLLDRDECEHISQRKIRNTVLRRASELIVAGPLGERDTDG